MFDWTILKFHRSANSMANAANNLVTGAERQIGARSRLCAMALPHILQNHMCMYMNNVASLAKYMSISVITSCLLGSCICHQ